MYPDGVLRQDEDGTWDGVNEDGSPTYPDQVVGDWTCYGRFIGKGMQTETGPWVFTTQYYDFHTNGGEEGSESFSSTGYELVDVGRVVYRAATGGTGCYKNLRGESQQTHVGFQKHGPAVTLRVCLYGC